MKCALVLISILFSTSSMATCFEFELIGEGVIEDMGIKLIIAKDTQSEVRLEIPLKEQDLLAPYIKRWVKARVILNEQHVDFNSKILKLSSVEYQTPDPLNMSSKTSIKKLKEIKCP